LFFIFIIGEAGDNVGVLLRNVQKKDVTRGECLVKPGSQNVYRNFESELYILKEEEGGRHKPFFSAYQPQVIPMNTNNFSAL
jgi:elongation factor Tu